MSIGFFFKGLIIGISIAAPVGPIGVLCVQRTLVQGRLRGFVSGLGAATADAFYGMIAAFGLTIVSDFMVAQQVWFRLIGGVFLLVLGVRAFLAAPPAGPGVSANPSGHAHAYLSTLFFTLTNPMTIVAFAAIFAGLGLVRKGADYLSASFLVLGVFLGSALWWLILSTTAGMVRRKVGKGGLRWVNIFAGAVITTFGLLALVSIAL